MDPSPQQRHVAVQGQMPEASEEDWERRREMRAKAISIVKSTAEYQWYESRASRGERPRTPDPADRTVSKRRWKYDVEMWRTELRRLCSDGAPPGVTDHAADANAYGCNAGGM